MKVISVDPSYDRRVNIQRSIATEKIIDKLIYELKGQKDLTRKLRAKLLAQDLSDIGSTIGFFIEQERQKNPDLMGFDWFDFTSGLKHGKSIVDGTHDLTNDDLQKAVEYYDNLEPYSARRNLQDEFGQPNIPNREGEFFKWLAVKLKNES